MKRPFWSGWAVVYFVRGWSIWGEPHKTKRKAAAAMAQMRHPFEKEDRARIARVRFYVA